MNFVHKWPAGGTGGAGKAPDDARRGDRLPPPAPSDWLTMVVTQVSAPIGKASKVMNIMVAQETAACACDAAGMRETMTKSVKLISVWATVVATLGTARAISIQKSPLQDRPIRLGSASRSGA